MFLIEKYVIFCVFPDFWDVKKEGAGLPPHPTMDGSVFITVLGKNPPDKIPPEKKPPKKKM